MKERRGQTQRLLARAVRQFVFARGHARPLHPIVADHDVLTRHRFLRWGGLPEEDVKTKASFHWRRHLPGANGGKRVQHLWPEAELRCSHASQAPSLLA